MLGSATDAELDVMLEEILEVIDAHEGQVLASNFPKCYYKVHGKPLNFKDLGYNKLSDLIRRLPGVYVEAGSHAFVRRAGGAAGGAAGLRAGGDERRRDVVERRRRGRRA